MTFSGAEIRFFSREIRGTKVIIEDAYRRICGKARCTIAWNSSDKRDASNGRYGCADMHRTV
jgi:hypothetical protein